MNILKLILAVVLIGIAAFLWQWAKKPAQVEPVPVESPIKVTSPLPNSVVMPPLVVTGEARGTWFFEGSFPVVLLGWDGAVIAESFATAEGEWMTEDFVPFSSTLNFPFNPSSDSSKLVGKLVLKKDNPSGLPENDASFEVPVKF